MVMDDAVNGLSESATYCRKGDDKRPSLVGLPDGSTKQVCPLDGSEVKNGVIDAYPQGWFVRVMFDELLDPSIEDLTEIIDDDGNPTGTYSGSIAATHPVNLKCTGVAGAMVDIPYDGYYSPSGNNVTWPLGPSIVIKPNFPATVPSTAMCQVTLNDNILDKNDGVPVPSDERGPYTFQISKIKVASISPADKDNLDPVDAGMDIVFNTLIDPDSIDTDGVVTLPTLPTKWAHDPAADDTGIEGFVANGGVTAPATLGVEPMVGGKKLGAAEWFIFADYYAKTDYDFTIPDGTKLKDLCGVETTLGAPSVDDQTQVHFTTNDITFTGITPTDGTMASVPGTKIQLKFNQYMDPDSLKGHCTIATTVLCASDDGCTVAQGTCTGQKFTLSPTVTNMDIIEDLADGSKIDIYGDFQLGTDYTFTLNASTTINECPGAEVGACGANPRTYLNADQQVVHFKTAAAIALTSVSPADNATITKVEASGAQARTSITLTFNQEMDPSTFTQDTDYTIEPNIVLTASSSTTNLLNTRLRPPSPGGYPPGTYTFTLKAGASFDDYLGNHYVQAADKVIHFTIKDPDPIPDCLP
jgi:hypothetical protein